MPARTSHATLGKGRKVEAKLPRKASGNAKEQAKRKRDYVGKAVIHEWKDGSGEVRIGRTVVRMFKGEEDVSTWTDEELMRGAPMSVMRIPNVIPMMVYTELVKRITSKVQHRFAAELQMAVNEHMKLINGRKVPPAVKLQAIKELYERVLGKPEEHLVVHDGDAPWRQMVASAIVGDMGQAKAIEGEIVEGEVVEDDDS